MKNNDTAVLVGKEALSHFQRISDYKFREGKNEQYVLDSI